MAETADTLPHAAFQDATHFNHVQTGMNLSVNLKESIYH
jgi:hypothetical protein